MRLFAKIVLCGSFIFTIGFLAIAYFFLTFYHEKGMEQEIKLALQQYQYNKFTLQAGIITNEIEFQSSINNDITFLNDFASEVSGEVSIYSNEMELIFSNITYPIDLTFPNHISEETFSYRFQKIGDKGYIATYGLIVQNEISLYLMTVFDISILVEQQEVLMRYFTSAYTLVLLSSMILLFLLSAFLTRPINRMTKIANRIASGRYDERLPVTRRDELGELAESFNLMVGAVEEKMDKLSESVKQKEDFVANFAHELKTPLTSIMGYADMIYQKNLTPEEVKQSAWYVLSESMRLESLSLKLMDLIVLNHQEFILEEMATHELLEDIMASLDPVLNEKQILLQMDIDPAYLKVDYDLFATMLLNIVDNAMKAGSSEIRLIGSHREDFYYLQVIDNGRGIPIAEIQRIKEAFYMVDKSRSRKQHGAGLGLALVDKIVTVHDGVLSFQSKETMGTVVELVFPCKGGELDE